MELEAARKLLDELTSLSSRVERPRTFMEIAGHPHYENQCSNILAFYMDPSESHGFGTLVLDALLIELVSDTNEALQVSGNVEVSREVSTSRNNRIDILITSDTHAILIENKIYAVANNPFQDYADFLAQEQYATIPVHKKLLLTLYSSSEGMDQGFENLTYSKFVRKIRSLLGNYTEAVDHRHLTLFLDFLNTVENFQRGSNMNPEFIQFLAKNEKNIKVLFNDLKDLRAEMHTKCEELSALVNTDPLKIKQGFWRNNIVDMHDNISYRFNLASDLPMGIDAHISPQGWKILVFPKPEKDQDKLSKLRNIFDDLDIPLQKTGDSWRPIYTRDFKYDTNLQNVGQYLQDLINKLVTYEENSKVRL